MPFELLFGDVSRLRIINGDRFGERLSLIPFSLSGDGDELPPDAELRRDDPIRTSKCRKRNVTSFLLPSSEVLLNKNANGHEIHEDSLKKLNLSYYKKFDMGL